MASVHLVLFSETRTSRHLVLERWRSQTTNPHVAGVGNVASRWKVLFGSLLAQLGGVSFIFWRPRF